MITFIIGLLILVIGGYLYGEYIEKVFGPDERSTPAVELADGVDFVSMSKWKNSLIQLLNIAGTGPIIGPIQGILFGPIAFLTIPIGCIIAGATHDYFCGMISMREKGAQMPTMLQKYLGKVTNNFYQVFLAILIFLVGAVFITTPGDLFITEITKGVPTLSNPMTMLVYGAIFVYYLIATLYPIDKIIGRIYPTLGAILLISAVGVFIGIFTSGYQLTELSLSNMWGIHPKGLPFIPIFFITVACGIASGFHATQSTLIGRSVTSEREGKETFFYMMLLEGFIAMIWAAAAMGIYNKGIPANFVATPAVVGLIANDLLGSVGGMIAVLGVIILPITSGDTALRALRLMIAEHLGLEQKTIQSRLMISIPIFALVAGLLYWSKSSADGFNILWRYFGWANQVITVFGFATIASYLYRNKKNALVALLPGMFYAFIVSSYIFNASFGFSLNMNLSYILGAVFTVLYALFIKKQGSINKL